MAMPPRELPCYKIMHRRKITQESKRSLTEPTNGSEIVNREYMNRPVSVRCSLPSATRQALINLLKKDKHVFPWTPTDMVGVDREVIEHKLMIKLGAKENKKKKMSLGVRQEHGNQCRDRQAN